MSKLSRILIAVAGVLLGGMYVLPLWSIGLLAPQYPEGLGMVIGIRTISGRGPNDLDNINHLNHYIGMKVIDAGAIPELRVMPWIVALLIAAALAIAVWPKRGLVIGWLAALAAFGVAGVADFWRWSYDYGHNIDAANAIIKIPGTVYDPPILGTRQILNFTATSWPAAGTWFALAAFALGFAALLLARRGLVVPPSAADRYPGTVRAPAPRVAHARA